MLLCMILTAGAGGRVKKSEIKVGQIWKSNDKRRAGKKYTVAVIGVSEIYLDSNNLKEPRLSIPWRMMTDKSCRGYHLLKETEE